MSSIAASYDELPYESNACVWSHPERLATIAKLYGLDAPPVAGCRILELGCANGANLLPLACAFPEARLLGIDLSPRQIADGQAVATALNLANIELRCASILDLDLSLGTFDYILCHGVYSWAPAVVQDRILEICARQLAPHGLAYVDYNTLPGWQRGRLLREITYFHARRFPDGRQRLAEARRLLDFLARAVPPQAHGDYAGLLRSGAEHFHQRSDAYLLHEYLDEANESLYFHEFARRAADKQLQHVADARFPSLLGAGLGPEVDAWLEQISSDPTEREQYIDLVANRAFRRSILCHAHETLAPTRYSETLAALHVASSAQPQAPEPDLFSTAAESFQTVGGVNLVVHEPPLKTALFLLSRAWPASVPFDALDRQTSARLGQAAPQVRADVRQTLMKNLLSAFLGHQGIEFHVHPPRCASATTPRPAVSPLVAYQAAHGFSVTSLRHQTFEVSEGERQLLRRLDGSLERPELLAIIEELMVRDLLKPLPRGIASAEPSTPSPVELLDHYLARFASWSLFLEPQLNP